MEKAKWWQDAAVYQIYPRSFYDSNGDGIGDIKGITEKLDYIASLGVDVIWSSPFFVSPWADGGYDIADYRNISPDFGTMEDFEEMIAGIHERGMKFMMDFVGNHTSDEHPWFQAALKDKESPYHDYYIFRKGRDGREPSNWASIFGGSAWEYVPELDEYYLHLFAKKQPDLNWENPKVVSEVLDILDFWADKGVDGYRLDAINYLYKEPDFPDVEPMSGSPYGFATEHYANKPKVHEHFRTLHDKVMAPRGLTTVAEVAYLDEETARGYADPARGELDALYPFDLLNVDQEGYDKFSPLPLDLPKLKKALSHWQNVMHDHGWLALFIGNHDQPRALSRFGDEDQYPVRSAKLLANAMYFLQGTPYIYQGDELGMTVPHYTELSQFRDVEAINALKEGLARGESKEHWLKLLDKRSRDGGRAPFSWDTSDHAGFTTGRPWMDVCANYKDINAELEEHDADSVLNFYRRLLKVRKGRSSVLYGRTEFLEIEDPKLLIYERIAEDEILISVNNFSRDELSFRLPDKFQGAELLISNCRKPDIRDGVARLRPWEAFTLIKTN
ncbi:MAG TPA: alpha-glucosidase [Candidatus Avilachnospira avistercoris]|nr:alpha-glucosidase [Candidatus Avilachnospira avistercoris]